MGSSQSTNEGEQRGNTSFSLAINSNTSFSTSPPGAPHQDDPTSRPSDVNDIPPQSPHRSHTQTQQGYSYDSPVITSDSPRQSAGSLNTSVNNSPLFSTNDTSLNGTVASSDDFKFELFGTMFYPFRWLTLPTLYSWLGPLSSIAMIIGCVMPYVPQYLTIHKNHSSRGFSTFVCLTLLMANILRVAFWYGHPFELPLLVQSVVMILAQILLLELCIRLRRQRSQSNIRFPTSSLKYFWRWTDLTSHLLFLSLFAALLGIAMYFLKNCEPFVETIGYCALVIESMLGLPQVLENYRNKSVKGMSLSMVFMWLGGDTFKTGYFVANDVPFQFWLCGLLQITIDLLILIQVCLFRQNAPVKVGSRSDYSPKEMAL